MEVSTTNPSHVTLIETSRSPAIIPPLKPGPDPLLQKDTITPPTTKASKQNWIINLIIHLFQKFIAFFSRSKKASPPLPKIQPTNTKDDEAVFNFYVNDGTIPRGDCQGLTRTQVLNSGDHSLEANHNFIQWLFLSDQKSGAQPGSPITHSDLIAKCKESETFIKNLRSTFKEFLPFYGLEWSESEEKVIRRTGTDDPRSFEKREANWLKGHNHNFARISRIIYSLRLHGLEKEAKALFDCLTEIYQDPKYARIIGEKTYKEYWQKYATIDLSSKPKVV